MNDQTSNPLDTIANALKELSENKTSHDIVFSDIKFLEFKAKNKSQNYGKGLIFTSDDYTKQFIFSAKPDRFFSTENIDLAKERHFSINSTKVLDEKELGPTITKSSLKELGRLKGLIVDGSVSINQYLFYNGNIDRLGLGTDSPNAAFSVSDRAVEVMIGTSDNLTGMIGTHAAKDLDLVTDSTSRISIKSNGDIFLGNPNKNSIQVTVHGKMAVGVKVADPNVDLHVAGPVRLNNHIQMYATAAPATGTYTVGDIVWNQNPSVGKFVGWVCVRAGTPGSWYPFGQIAERG